jgi:hypothetical protein
VITEIKKLFEKEGEINQNNFFDKMILALPLKNILLRLGKGDEIYKDILLITIMIEYENQFDLIYGSDKIHSEVGIEKIISSETTTYSTILKLLDHQLVKKFLGVNEYEGITYYNKENFSEILSWFYTMHLITYKADEKELVQHINKLHEVYSDIENISIDSNYIMNKLTKGINKY